MKKITAILLAALFLFSAVGAFAEYDSEVTFTVCTSQTQSAGDYNSDGLAKYVMDKFNVNYEVWPIAYDSHDEKVRVWINSESMPTMASWMSWNYSELLDYVDQGLIGGLPEGWKETYPNLAHMIEMTGIEDMLTVDGTLYAIPNAVFGVYCNMENITDHATTWYRKDWATTLGYEFDETTTLSEFKAFLKDCIDKDMSGTGTTYGLVANNSYVNGFFFDSIGVDYDSFMELEDGMVWAPTMEGYTDTLKTMREWYNEGLIHPDYYLLSSTDAPEYFYTGNAAANRKDGPVSAHVATVNGFSKNGIDPEAAYGWTLVTGDDGVAHSMETTNFWTLILFNPDTDEETMNRSLAIIDWLCSEEGILCCQMGVPGVEWDYDENGDPYYLDVAKAEDGSVVSQYDRNPSYRVWRQLGLLSDDFNFVSPAYPKWVQDSTLRSYEVKSGADVVPYNFDYRFFSSETKNVYSVDIVGAVTEVVIGTEDVETMWNRFIENNSGMWKPLLDELNAEYFGK